MLRDLIAAHLDDWADGTNSLAVEHRVEGYRAALDDPATDLLAIATELEVPL